MEIRKQWTTLPVLAISGGDRTGWCDFLRMASEFGANDTMAKPFSAHELVARGGAADRAYRAWNRVLAIVPRCGRGWERAIKRDLQGFDQRHGRRRPSLRHRQRQPARES
jgi:DNA-binding response OmpR family regulator